VPKRDEQATKAAKFLNRESWIGKRLHPGTNKPCQYLKGRDVEFVRMRVFERDKGRCRACGRLVDWDWGELHHLVGGLGLQRCWCEANLAWSCASCHRKEHVQVQWTRRIA